MSIIECDVAGAGTSGEPKLPSTPRPLHRLGIVRRLQGISRRSVARRMDVEVARIKIQERPTSDLLLSKLYEWQSVLEVPIAELLVEGDDQLATPVLRRAQLVRMMKTALAMLEASHEEPIRRMAQTLIAQLTQVMPELQSVNPWHTVGKRRCQDEFGIAANRRLSDDVFLDLMD
jgi:transcriptional regulator with XRE-family HTH domain